MFIWIDYWYILQKQKEWLNLGLQDKWYPETHTCVPLMYESVSFSRSMSASPKRPFCNGREKETRLWNIQCKNYKWSHATDSFTETVIQVRLKAWFPVLSTFLQPPRWYYHCWSTFSTDWTVPACLWSVSHCQTWGRTFWNAAIHPHPRLPPALICYVIDDCHTVWATHNIIGLLWLSFPPPRVTITFCANPKKVLQAMWNDSHFSCSRMSYSTSYYVHKEAALLSQSNGKCRLVLQGHTSSTAGPSYNTTSFSNNSVLLLEKCSEWKTVIITIIIFIIIINKTLTVSTRSKMLIPTSWPSSSCRHTPIKYFQGSTVKTWDLINVSKSLKEEKYLGTDLTLLYSLSVPCQELEKMLKLAIPKDCTVWPFV